MCTSPLRLQIPSHKGATNGLITPVAPRSLHRALKPNSPSVSLNTGRWFTWERLRFLQGLRLYGKGNWKKISELISTRTTIQVKTHGQVVLKRIAQGEDVFAELDRFERFVESSATKDRPQCSPEKGSPVSNLKPEDFDAAHILVIMRK